MVCRPQFLALDSSHLRQWISDWSSPRTNVRRTAADFEAWLEDQGLIPLVTLHHLEELCGHGSEATVRRGLDCLARLKMVAWVADEGGCPGGVTTLGRAEAECILRSPEADLFSVRDAVWAKVLRCGTGLDLLGEEPDLWLALKPLFEARGESSRDLVALAYTDVVDISARPMSDLLGGRVRTGADLHRSLELLAGSFAVDIALRGDERIKSARNLADDFVDEVRKLGEALPANPTEFVKQSLALQGVLPEEIRPDATVGEMLDLGLFRSQLKVLFEGSEYAFEDLTRIRSSQMPTWLIQTAMRRFTPQPKRRSGSEVNDTYLACLAPYADLTLVDKRVREGFRRAADKMPEIAKITRRVERAPRYDRIPGLAH